MIANETLAHQQSLKVNGKSFNWAAFFLNAKQAKKAAALYSFCRVLDDLADEEGLAGFERLQNIKNDLKLNRSPSDNFHLKFNNFTYGKNSFLKHMEILHDLSIKCEKVFHKEFYFELDDEDDYVEFLQNLPRWYKKLNNS